MTCKCFARCEADCVCDHDWTPPAVIALREEVERLRAELAAWRSALAKVGPYYIPATNVSDEEAEEVYAAIDAARKGEGE